MSLLRPSGTRLIQMLNVVVLNEYDALQGGPDWPGDDFVLDPSTAGDPSVWGTRVIGIDPDTGDPITGRSLGTRTPGGSGGTPPKRRKGGTGMQPSKNILTHVDASSPRACFAGSVRVRISSPSPIWDGQQPAFTTTQGSCKPYNPPTVPRPATGLTLGTPNLLTQVETFLNVNVNVPGTIAVVISDSIQGPGVSCTVDATCPGFSAESYGGTGVGVVIT